ncbi:hypothetical protein DICPUDRAFT_147119 [Dictyostelium purpureum]|uniref:Serine protease n=1 Tax=Dictyostelium purpureum TaxID=5786 RepID=F0Z7Q0_DICPU|nr:uncharacterized protein DICPUDRAFT_147119 [Dictyostelium purpureum]EGC40102.1 hypothetical protein DICPUDRAFT_147119 [Dictyostelium purpureum]|eukprot:XP_003283451.1 hypothetical protein DICPUDRAFT_147119 [Dictyostelium purpureum]
MRIVILLLCLLLGSLSLTNAGFLRNHDSTLNKGLRARGAPSSSPLSDRRPLPTDPPAQWFNNQVDHYNPLNTETFKQRYYVNDTYWTPGGPVFLVLGGEGPISPSYVTGHFVVNYYAPMFDALIVAVEHRFYGASTPKGNLATENLKYLSTQQALADYANFVQFFKQKYNTGDSKWVSFGGSYSGNLSAWLRLKYPNLIDAAIATSAPVKPVVDFPEYFEVVSNSIGPSCSAFVANITKTVTDMINNGQNDQVAKLFNACDPIVSDLDIATFMESLSGGISEIVQYNLDNNAYTFTNITAMCEEFEQGSDPMQTFIDFNNRYNTFSGSPCTLSSYEKSVIYQQNIDPANVNASSRSWNWQCCTEYGYYQTGESPSQPFSSTITLDYFINMCTDVFGPEGFVYKPQVDYIITDYGSTNIQSSNIVMASGTIDPWSFLGVHQTPLKSSVQPILIQGGAHCSELYMPKEHDLPDVVTARLVEIQLIKDIL